MVKDEKDNCKKNFYKTFQMKIKTNKLSDISKNQGVYAEISKKAYLKYKK